MCGGCWVVKCVWIGLFGRVGGWLVWIGIGWFEGCLVKVYDV